MERVESSPQAATQRSGISSDDATERAFPTDPPSIDRPPCREGAPPPSVLRECPASGRRGGTEPAPYTVFYR